LSKIIGLGECAFQNCCFAKSIGNFSIGAAYNEAIGLDLKYTFAYNNRAIAEVYAGTVPKKHALAPE
jgi:hypothetical protein